MNNQNPRLRSLIIFLVIFFSHQTIIWGSPTENVVTLEGEISLTFSCKHDHDSSAPCKEHYNLRTKDNKIYHLDFNGKKRPEIGHGKKVKIQGKKLEQSKEGEDDILVLEVSLQAPGSNQPSGGGKLPADTGMLGVRSAVVVLLKFQDTDTRLTWDQANQMMWGATNSVADAFARNSRGKLTFAPDSDKNGVNDVIGPITLPYTAANSPGHQSGIMRDAEAIIRDAGYNIGSSGFSAGVWQHRIYVLPPNDKYDFGGSASYRGGDVYIRSAVPFVFTHELGHNLGLYHATSTSYEYGDLSCQMGISYGHHFFAAPYNHGLGFSNSSEGRIVDYAPSRNQGSQNFTIHALAKNPSEVGGPQILRIAKRDQTGVFYYLSCRDSTSYDANLRPEYKTGLSVHRRTESDGGGYAEYGSTILATLSNGGSFRDEVNGIYITQLGQAQDGSSVNINVTMSSGFTSSAPSLTAKSYSENPGDENTVGAFESSFYLLTLTNNDSLNTPPTTFQISLSDLPSGMVTTCSENPVVLSPQSSKSIVLEVNPNGTTDGSYNFGILAEDVDGVAPAHTAALDSAAIKVDSTSEKPEAPTGLTASYVKVKRAYKATLSWTPSASTNVAYYSVFKNADPLPDRIELTSATTLSLTLGSGNHTFLVAAVSDTGKLSEPVSVNLSVP